MHALHKRSVEVEGRRVLRDDDGLALSCILKCVGCARPIVVTSISEQTSLVVYTDGAVEGEHFVYGTVIAVPGWQLR
eukprot:1345009-Amphidinium_carterae.1